jgi:hypothetical protein
MTMQPDPNASFNGMWSWAVQRELDGFQKTMDNKFSELTNRIDKVVSSIEYAADKRSSDIQLANLIEHISEIKTDLEKETLERKKEHDEYVKTRQVQFRWFVSMIIIPIVLGIVQLVMSKK